VRDSAGRTLRPKPSFEPLEPRLLLNAGPVVGDVNETDLTSPLGPCVDATTDTRAADGVTGFTLVNADTDSDIGPLNDGDTINLTVVGTSLSIRADVSGSVSSVRFGLDGNPNYRTENVAPYALAGDSSGDYHPWTPSLGSHTVVATPNVGSAMQITFQVVDETVAIPTADAGPDRHLFLPQDSTTLDGSGSSDPDGTITGYQWTKESGPAATMAGADTDTLSLTNLVEGTYVFRLTVTDNHGQTDWDEATVRVAPEGSGEGTITGELKTWHRVTITWDGPATSETAATNPFLDYRLQVTFTGPSGQTYEVPGYYAADGDAANTGADSGNKWRCHLAPDEAGPWSYSVSFRTGNDIAVSDDPGAGSSAGYFDGDAGSFIVAPTDKTGRDFRGKGLLEYVGGHYLRFAETGEYFLKQGADAPENFLAYEDFDGGFKSDGRNDGYIKSWSYHAGDWNAGDPSWSQCDGASGTYGTEMIGAINYLASEGMNAFSFIPMNIGGDDKNVFPYLDYNERYRMDVSRLDQWEIVFEHATAQGMFLHFKTQETENELLLDGGDLGIQRKLYYRELIARFSHHLALNWNLGEEINNASTGQKKAWAEYFWTHDPYQHHIVIHNGANHYDLLGPEDEGGSYVTGFSKQTNNSDFSDVHAGVKDYIDRSDAAGKPWAVACDEPGDASHALRPAGDAGNSWEDGRKNGVWGTFMAGGWGDEWYFGYNHAHSDLTCEDFRSRDGFWDYCRYALDFFNDNDIPFHQMTTDNRKSTASDDYCFYQENDTYVVYLKNGGTTSLDLSGATGTFTVRWFDPRNGGALQTGTVTSVSGGGTRSLGQAPHDTNEDWAVLVQKVAPSTRVVGVALNPDPARTVRTVSDIEPSGIGVDTVEIAFNEAVNFTADALTVQRVHFEGGDEVVDHTFAAADMTVNGSGTNTLTVKISNGWENAVDTWVKITVSDGAGHLADLQGHALDGEARLNASGLGYIYDADLDLPSGDGTAGGSAVFYVGSLRGDMRGFGPVNKQPNGTVDSWDINGFTSKYIAGDLDADFRGFGPVNKQPNGTVDSWDINGFTSRYTQAIANGTHLDDLPTAGGLGTAAGSRTQLPPEAPSLANQLVTNEQIPGAPRPASAELLSMEIGTLAAADKFTSGLNAEEGIWAVAVPAPTVAEPVESSAAPVLDPDAGVPDLLALPALGVRL